MNHYPKMTELSKSFPTLRDNAQGIEPFDPWELDVWACRGVSHGELFAVKFVLAVFKGHAGRLGNKPRWIEKDAKWVYPIEATWGCGVFDVVDAMGTWDAAHREAFVAWAREPWWP